MHGLIVNQLRQFVITRHGRDAWSSLVSDVEGLGGVPSMDRSYPDGLVTMIVQRAAVATKTPEFDLLREFGIFLAPVLLRIYEPLLDRRWRTLDVIEHTEEQIHTVVRARDEHAKPPALVARRISTDEVVIDYSSARRMCAVAEGIAQGMAVHFGDVVTISQQRCMHKGDARCEIHVVTAAGSR